MSQNSVQYGDTVFITFPTATSAPLIVTGVGSSQTNHPIATSGTIDNADPYIIVDPNGGPARPIQTGDYVALQRIDGGGYWYNKSGDSNVEINPSALMTDNRSIWYVNNLQNTTNQPVIYGTQYRLLNVGQAQNPTYSGTNINTGNIQVKNQNTSNQSVIAFLPGDINTARLQCCQQNTVMTTSGLCGNYAGSCNNNCDDILTQYCATNQTDPKCGCLLPASAYNISGQLGPPECIDTRCVNVVDAYRRQQQCNTKCNITDCTINLTNADFQQGNVSTAVFQQQCGFLPPGVQPNSQPIVPNHKNNNLLIIIIIAIIIILLIIATVLGFIFYRK